MVFSSGGRVGGDFTPNDSFWPIADICAESGGASLRLCSEQQMRPSSTNPQWNPQIGLSRYCLIQSMERTGMEVIATPPLASRNGNSMPSREYPHRYPRRQH